MRFEIDPGVASLRGPRERNEDFAGLQFEPGGHGLVAALADGVSTGGEGLLAAQTSVRTLLADFHATPTHWDPGVRLERLLAAQNSWLSAHNRRPGADGQAREALCTCTALALQGRRFALAHVGDSRAWLLREGQLLQLTQDHRLPRQDFAGLTRALGLDPALHLDHSQGELRVGDRLLLSSDGLHGPLRARVIARMLRETPGAQAAAEALCQAALQAGGHDNVTALVLDVQGLAAADLDDLQLGAAQLPSPPLLGVGAQLDGYQVTAVVADNGVHRLLQARELASGELVAIKTLHPSRAHDAEERALLAHEIWLGLRLTEDARGRRGGPASGLVALRRPGAPSHFYAVFDWHPGQTLEQLLAAPARPELNELLQMAREIGRALSLLHAAGCVHRDVKPANLHRGEDGHWRLLDLGVALSPRSPRALRGLHAGTPSYINPEQWDEPPHPPDAGADLFALGVTLYQALAGRLPWGEIEPYQRARYARAPQPLRRLRPDLPIWLDHLVLKAIAQDPKERFETADEFLLALERGAARSLPAPRATPLAARNPLLLWQLGLAVSLLFNGLLVVWLLGLPKG